MPKIYGKRKKTKTHQEESQELPSSIPRSIVLRRGKVGANIKNLIKELKVLLYPFCAVNLKESNKNTLKDFLSLVDVYGFSHMFALTNTEKASYLKLAKMPSGPTLTFKINEYCLAADIFRENKNKIALTKIFNHIPLCILNGFSNSSIPAMYKEPLSIASTMFQSIFPPLNINELNVNQAKRSLLVNLNLDENKEPVIELRHYDIDTEKSSGKKTISNILNMKKTDLSNFQNIADYILKQSGFTDASDNEDNEVNVISGKVNKLSKDEDNSKIKITDNAMKVKLNEIGPRLSLKLIKIEEGFFKGNVAFHGLVKKSKKEIIAKSKELKEKKLEKQKRREEQEANVKRKEEEKFAKLPEEKQREIIEQRENQEAFLGRKREKEMKEERDAQKETVMTKGDIKYLKKLKSGK